MPIKRRKLSQSKKQREAIKSSRERFLKTRKAGRIFTRQLRSVAKQIGMIVSGLAPKGIVRNIPELNNTLSRYAELLQPWAKLVVQQMIAEVDQKDRLAWNQVSKEIGEGLREEINNAPIGQIMKDLMDEQVDLITSLPLKSAQRVHKLTIEAIEDGTRAADVAKEIMRTGKVIESRAMLIARTELARTSSILTQARSEYVGAEAYIWETSQDADVRHSHKKMQGKIVYFDNPPTLDGLTGHAGQLPNCRCWMNPILPKKL